MKYSGNLIGLVVEEGGKKKDALRLSIMDHLLKIICKLPENMSGQIGGCRCTSRRVFHHCGRRS
jgi:hypothetical protein